MTIPLSWQVEGPAGAPVLVLLHSIGTTSSMWDPVVGPLAEQFRVVRIEARGHGRSPGSPAGDPCTVADLGLDVLAALDVIEAELACRRVHLAGLSLGGMTAMWLAIHHPERIARLALLCTAAHLPPARGWLDRAAQVRAHGMGSIVERVVSGWITPGLTERDPVMLAGLRDMLADADAESYAQCCEAIATLDLRSDLGRVAAPTLVIAASDDAATPPAHADLIGEAIPGARVEVVANAAHIATVEQPGVIARLLLAHFGGGATLEAGYRTRRDVLGDEHVDAAVEGTTELTAAFQELITRYAWGDVWSRPGLSRRERSIATLAALVTMGAEREIAMHVRAAIRNGLTRGEIGEVLLHTALYAGLPRAGRAFAIATEVLDALDVEGQNG
jgi:3-oxoadipate enol-lactonase/4-carboxymuconolactone decarboxylase